MNRIAMALLSAGLLIAPVATLSAAEEKKTTKPSAAAKESTSKTKASAKGEEATAKKSESGGRLPRFFASLVDDEQREQIYAVQEKFRSKIDALRMQLEELEAEQLTAIEGVLTAAQRKELDSLRAGTGTSEKEKEKEAPKKSETTTKKKAA